MTESLLERSARSIDGAVYDGPASVSPVDSSFHFRDAFCSSKARLPPAQAPD